MTGPSLQRFGILTVLFGGFSAYIDPSSSATAMTIMLIGFVVGLVGFVLEGLAAMGD
ncbi:hypothetical protein [Salinadaptatus halalkaliphilus]|uniref:hypothetical protein n=1 Tax=Salinadaptatus halalkaliphilus TaxID=2419781 RepID=UPI001581048A|nr:hypothetical protein [Salinadaptatus halalkaliphilus]